VLVNLVLDKDTQDGKESYSTCLASAVPGSDAVLNAVKRPVVKTKFAWREHFCRACLPKTCTAHTHHVAREILKSHRPSSSRTTHRDGINREQWLTLP
jgi:hypothetical protein